MIIKHVLLSLFSLVLGSSLLYSQIGIGTVDPVIGTILHVDDGTGLKGVKLPDANIVDLNTVDPLPVGTEEGTMVYNTNSFTGQGHFYWNGFVWAPIQLFANRSAKFEFADAGSNPRANLNTISGADIELMDGVVFNENAGLFTPVADGSDSFNSVQVDQDGRYRITVFISLELDNGNGNGAIFGRVKIADDSIVPLVRYDGSIHRSTEMDKTGSGSSGIDDDGTLYFTEIIELHAQERVSIECSTAQGTIEVGHHDDRGSAFIIEKLR